MNFNQHLELLGKHAFLGASKYHWINYDENHLVETYLNYKAAEEGTATHEFAALCISRGQKLPASKATLNMYVNDAIGYKMTPEQVLYYSDNCFGTADAISFKKNKLRIHDLKTGVTPASPHQLEIYAAIFCLEYGVRPEDIDIELRIYQTNTVNIFTPDSEVIKDIMDKIISFDEVIEKIRAEELM